MKEILLLKYRAFHGFGEAKFAYSGSSLGSTQFTLLRKLPLKMILNLKVVKIESRKIISLFNLNQ